MSPLLRRNGILWFTGLALAASALSPTRARAEIPDALEPDYSEAVLAYNARDFLRSLNLINELLKKSPGQTEFLELKALALKSQNDKQESAKTYEDLIAAKKRDNRPEKETAPYHFELGVIRFGEKKFSEARNHFLVALEHDFNEGPAHLYLGMDSFRSGAWSDAEDHFSGVISSSAVDLKPASYFYLGQAQTKTDYAQGAIDNFIRAQATSKSILDSRDASEGAKKIAQQIYDSTEKALKPFDKSAFFANVGFMTGYDSNPLSNPEGQVTTATTSTNASTAKETLMGGVGYATSPLGFIQWVPSYRASFNMNLARGAAAAGEFFNQTLSLVATRGALERFNYGFKTDYNFAFRNNDPSGGFNFAPFSHLFSAQVFLRYELFRKFILGLEGGAEPQGFFLDADDDNDRTGFGIPVRIFVQNEAGRRFFNPAAAVRAYRNETEGTQFRSMTIAFEGVNTMHLTAAMDLMTMIERSYWSYNERGVSGPRSDEMWLGLASLTYKWNPRWTFLASGDFTINRSGPTSAETSSFNFSRFGFNVGATYSF